MKNVTVALPEDVYRRARIKAAERDTSLSALMREFILRHLGEEETDFERRKRLQSEVLASIRSGHGDGRLKAAVAEVRRLREGERIATVTLASCFSGGIETEEQLDAVLAGLREECARLIGAGKKVLGE